MALRRHLRLWAPVAAGILYLLIHVFIPNKESVDSNDVFSLFLSMIVGLFLVLILISYSLARLHEQMIFRGPFIAGVISLVMIYEIITLKLALLPLPYFPSPPKILEAYVSDWSMLLSCLASSFKLLIIGFIIGIMLGFINGIVMGLFKKIDYWINPAFRFIGPIPAAALVPMSLIIAPSSFAAATFLIVFSVWYPVTVMTWSGVSSIDKSYFDVARTLGGGRWYQLRHIVLPAIMPSVFFGMYMGFCYSFATLVIAEMMGSSSGLGYYINWSMGWGSYYKLFAALIVVAILCSGLIWSLFKVRDYVLRWEKEKPIC